MGSPEIILIKFYSTEYHERKQDLEKLFITYQI